MIQIEDDNIRNRILAAWRDGAGDTAQTDLLIRGLAHKIREDEAVATRHLDLVLEIASGGLPVPAARMILVDCYRRGWAVKPDPGQAWAHLQAAMAMGSESARWFYGCYLLDNTGFEGALETDPNHALEIFRDLARHASDITVMELARQDAAHLLIQGRKSGDLSDGDEDLWSRPMSTITA